MKAVRISMSCVLAAYLALVFASSRGVVVCAGADGHVAIEAAYAGSFCSPSGPSTDCTDPSVSASHCGTCVDTPILTDTQRMRPFEYKQTIGACTGLLPAVNVAQVATIHLSQRLMLLNDALSCPPFFRRTTSLLI